MKFTDYIGTLKIASIDKKNEKKAYCNNQKRDKQYKDQ